MPRIKLTIAYTGTDYHGWQIQAPRPGAVEQPTVQSVVMRAVERVLGQRVHVHGAGRTDAGVHARAQVAHMDVPQSACRIDWQLALNTALPASIRIRRAEPAEPGFHAQRDALGKTYCYALWLDRRFTPPHLYPYVWNCGPVDEPAMLRAAPMLQGTRDFAALRNAGTDLESTERTVNLVGLEPRGPDTLLRVWRFEADGFLKQMVRNMMGLLVRVGQGKIRPEQVPGILEDRDRRHAGVTAPARGLSLYQVWYSPAEYQAGPVRFWD